MSDWYNDQDNTLDKDTALAGADTPSEESAEQEAVTETVQTDTAAETPAPAPQVPQAAPVPPTARPVAQPPYGVPRQTPYPASPYGQVPSRPGVPQGRSPYGAAQPPVSPQRPVTPPKKNKGNTVLIAILSIICVLSLSTSGVLGAVVLGDFVSSSSSNSSQSSPKDEDTDSSGNSSQNDEDDYTNENGPTLQITDADDVTDGGLPTSEIIEKNLDATVVLTMYQETTYGGFYDYGLSDSNLTEVGAASGIIMSEDGYIITNSHCVYDEEYGVEYDRIDVTLYDGRVYEGAQIIGYDPTTDLAVIKIDETGLSVAEFGDSSKLGLGDRVVTLGNSGGLEWSASQGIVSGLARDVYEDTGYAIKCLQVDAVINPGSSGGPLFNAYGQVVGVNSAKIVLTGYEGLGFSIPINEAKDIIDDLIKYGYATGRVSLGITGRTVTSIGYEGFGIESINDDSALIGTKARAGDIITHVNDVRVTNYEEMRDELTSYDVGDTVTLTLIRLNRQSRETEEFTVQVKLQEMK